MLTVEGHLLAHFLLQLGYAFRVLFLLGTGEGACVVVVVFLGRFEYDAVHDCVAGVVFVVLDGQLWLLFADGSLDIHHLFGVGVIGLIVGVIYFWR